MIDERQAGKLWTRHVAQWLQD